mmetsp:Transcript_18921/g.21122  ORF Transcript_18921/g.21122 Transcript_18921/m.21122 type:complete len:513 (-) Transcript_18921:151-1689(-)
MSILENTHILEPTKSDDDEDDSSSSLTTNNDFSREINRAKVAFTAFNYTLSRVNLLVGNVADGYSQNGNYNISRKEYREEMVRDLIERNAALCHEAVKFALGMKFRRCHYYLMKKEDEKESCSLINKPDDAIQTTTQVGGTDYQYHQQNLMRSRQCVMSSLKVGLLGMLKSIESSHLPRGMNGFKQHPIEGEAHNFIPKDDRLLDTYKIDNVNHEVGAAAFKEDEKQYLQVENKMRGGILLKRSSFRKHHQIHSELKKQNDMKCIVTNKSHVDNCIYDDICNADDEAINSHDEYRNKNNKRCREENKIESLLSESCQTGPQHKKMKLSNYDKYNNSTSGDNEGDSNHGSESNRDSLCKANEDNENSSSKNHDTQEDKLLRDGNTPVKVSSQGRCKGKTREVSTSKKMQQLEMKWIHLRNEFNNIDSNRKVNRGKKSTKAEIILDNHQPNNECTTIDKININLVQQHQGELMQCDIPKMTSHLITCKGKPSPRLTSKKMQRLESKWICSLKGS